MPSVITLQGTGFDYRIANEAKALSDRLCGLGLNGEAITGQVLATAAAVADNRAALSEARVKKIVTRGTLAGLAISITILALRAAFRPRRRR